MVKVYLLEYTLDGKRHFWPQSLGKKIAKSVAEKLRDSECNPKVVKLNLSKKQIKRMKSSA